MILGPIIFDMHKTWQTHKKMRSFYKNLIVIETCAFYGRQQGRSGGGDITWDVIMSVEAPKVGTSPPWGFVMTGAFYSCEGVSCH